MTQGEFDYPAPIPQATGEEAVWFEHCRGHRLMIQRCAECGEYQFPPRSVCKECLAASPDWVEAAGRGTVFTYSVQHRYAPGFAGQSPYVVAMIELSEGPRLLSRVVGSDDIHIGMAVEVRWASISEDFDVPVFIPAGEQADAG